ncbi:hypothetical protein [Novosphingobium sp. 9]|uniref:hypothetical protein n=1 Tax=Novosphingobium sp. 9 TaxID=2025349 RepID=UPI0021B6B377|nr:hypothetical protein [Novosphingobium sp. 9]
MIAIRKAQAAAREAVIAARFHGEPLPANPYCPGSASHRWWTIGIERAQTAADNLLRIGR